MKNDRLSRRQFTVRCAALGLSFPLFSSLGATQRRSLAPAATDGSTPSTATLAFPRVMLVGNGGDQSYGSKASNGYPNWLTAATGNAANTAIQTIGAYDIAILAGVYEGWDSSGARDRDSLVQALLKNASYSVRKNNTRPTLTFFYHNMNEGQTANGGGGYQQLINQIVAMNGWLYESPGGTGTITPSAFGGGLSLINYSTAWPGAVGKAGIGQSIVGANYGKLSSGSPTGAQGVARTNGNYAALKLLIRASTVDPRFTFNAQMASPNAAGVMLDNCFAALDGGGSVANSSLDGISMAPGSQQGGGFPALDTTQPLLARGLHNFFDQFQTMLATYGSPGHTYYNFGNFGAYANRYQFGKGVMTIGLENTMHGGLLESVLGAGAASWECFQIGNTNTGNTTYASGWPNLLANYYQAMDFCLAPKLVGLGARLPAADGSSSAAWVSGPGTSPIITVSADTALEYQLMRYGLCTTLLDDGYFAVGTSGYDWSKPRWYDEYGDDSLTQVNVKRGYLGTPLTTRPTSPTWNQGTMGVWARDFSGGKAIVNPRGNGAQTVALGKNYIKLSGTQQPSINNGATVSAVTLADGDGLILLGPI